MLFLYRVLIFIHVFFGFLYMLSHGAAFSTSFRLRQESDPKRVQALLDLSGSTYSLMYLSLLVLLAAGITLGFLGSWWSQSWIWISLGTLLVILVVMGVIASSHFHRLRKAVGMPFREGNKEHPGVDPASIEEIQSLLNSGLSHLLALIGLGGWGVILWMMLFKPF